MSKDEILVSKVKELIDQSRETWQKTIEDIQIAMIIRIKAEDGMSITVAESIIQQEQFSINSVVDILGNIAINQMDLITTPLIQAIKEIQSLPYGDDDIEVGS